ncbi:MAG: secretin and TonB N-terminal domain-containing protein, partial [Candidatus Omnitrophica bacterium]|nr:secretin and TonB N-terminal domain-containing protein [Candidatus Omnitrophota bacterium]
MKKKILILLAIVFLLASFKLSAQEDSLGELAKDISHQEETALGKISLDIKGMDIIDVLKILAMRGNLNVVAGKNVRGKVTVFLKNVEVMDALEIILAANDLAYEQKGDIINVMSDKDYEQLYGETSYDKKEVKVIKLKYAKVMEVSKALNQIKTKIGKVIADEASNTVVLIDTSPSIKAMEEAVKTMDLSTLTKTFILNYAKAEDIEKKIKESLTKNIGELKIDERMNKVIVTDLPERVEYISRVIADFDERDKVVLIEAKIVSVTLSKDVGYGINWNNVFAGIDTISNTDLSINLTGVSETATFTYTRAHGATEYGDQIILRLLESIGKTNVLSTPRITVANNQEAKVLVGTKEAYVTSTITQSNGTTTTADNVQFVDVGVSLTVTPTITADGYINMQIKPEVSSAPTSLQLTNSDGSVRTSVPIVTTSEAETQLLIKDGTTIIMAGLMKDTRKDNAKKIPFLGDIPLLGNFFKSSGKEDSKTELVIFITPHIIGEGSDITEHAQEYMREHEATGVKADYKPDWAPLPLSKLNAKEVD